MDRRMTWLVGLVSALGAGCGGSETPVDGGAGDTPLADAPLADAPSSADAPATLCAPGLPADLCFLREEEKLARDVYLALFAETGITVFDNISRSEQTHTDQVAAVLASRSIADPVTDDTPGAFVDPVFDELYATLTAEGRAGAVAALRVGATIEDLDLRDLAAMRARTTEPDALALYDSLACGSRNHMRSFAMQLSSRGETYEAVYIPADELAAILGSPREMCGP